MASQDKSEITITTSGIATDLVGNPNGAKTPLNELLALLKLSRVSISSNDTHLKYLEDALIAGNGISITVQNEGGDESLLISMDASTSAIDITATAGENLAIRDMIYLNASDNKWYKQDNDATGSVKMAVLRACATAAISADATGTIRLRGKIGGFTALTAGTAVYASATAGSYTQTKPTATTDAGQVVVSEMGVATSTTEIFIDPKSLVYIKKASLDDDENLTIEHHADANAFERDVLVLVDATTYHSQAQLTQWGSDSGFECRLDDGALSNPTTNTTIKNSTGGTLVAELQVRF